MPGIARVGDPIIGTHTCCGPGHPHATVGIILTGSGNVLTNSIGTVRVGDTGIHTDGLVLVLTGSPSVFANGIPVSRISDIVSVMPGPGIIVGGSINVSAN